MLALIAPSNERSITVALDASATLSYKREVAAKDLGPASGRGRNER